MCRCGQTESCRWNLPHRWLISAEFYPEDRPCAGTEIENDQCVRHVIQSKVCSDGSAPISTLKGTCKTTVTQRPTCPSGMEYNSTAGWFVPCDCVFGLLSAIQVCVCGAPLDPLPPWLHR